MEKVSLHLFFIYFSKKSHSKNKLITCRANNSTEHNIAEVSCKSRLPINQVKDDADEDYKVPPKLARLLKHEEK